MTSIPDIELSPTVHDPIHHVAHAFEREGENLWVHCWFEPHAHLPEHFHPTLEEHWKVLDGTIQLKTVMTSPSPALQQIVLPILARFAADTDQHTNRKTT